MHAFALYGKARQVKLKLIHLLLSFIVVSSFLVSCQTNLRELPTFSDNKQLQMVVVTPAGSNLIQEYDEQKKEFILARQIGLVQKINFLPLPGNLGFIPSTQLGSGETANPLDILVITESQPAGTVQEVIPIATILLDIAGELKYMIIAVPARPSARFIEATDLASLTQNYPAARQILHQWFLNLLPKQQVRIAGWKDEQFTETLIRKHMR